MNVNCALMNELRGLTIGFCSEPESDYQSADANTLCRLKRSKPIAKNIKWMRDLMWHLSQAMESVKISLFEEDLSRCGNILLIALEFSTTFQNLVLQLKDTSVGEELSAISDDLTQLLSEVLKDPLLILMRLVEFGFYMYEIESILEEQMMSETFGEAASSILQALKNISSGQVIRQVYYVHIRLLGSFMQEESLNKLQTHCKCQITILSKSDIRSKYCPPFYRAFEVNFEKTGGRPAELAKQLSELHDPSEDNPVKLAVTILRKPSGHEVVQCHSRHIPCVCS